jgi:pyridoxal 5'-phosphate synthase pdxT subunit
VRDGMPVFGSCAGMILLADRVLDGTADQVGIGGLDVTVRRNAFGRQVESFEESIAFEGVDDGPVHAVFIRAPWVEAVGEDVVPLARISDGAAAGKVVAVRQGPLLATSFHPELTGDARIHELFVRIVRGTT